MFFPIGQEHMSERRWPIVTFFLVAVSIVIFLQTSSMVQSESPELRAAKEHVLSFAAMHPELEIPDEARDMVQDYQRSHPEEWQVPSPLTESDPDTLSRSELQSEMNTRADDYAALYKSSFLAKY